MWLQLQNDRCLVSRTSTIMSAIVKVEIKQEDNINTSIDEKLLLNNVWGMQIKQEPNEIRGDDSVTSSCQDEQGKECLIVHSNDFSCVDRPQISKDFNCTQCNYTTKYIRNLRRHLLTHKAVKDFTCNQCDYATNKCCSTIVSSILNVPTVITQPITHWLLNIIYLPTRQ
uniref:C2H2-type domain-containing protein n=1 Tax=Photinus pyralis TaxID=7054 RepID=A0A1Y1KXZ9_PHOPY